MNELKFCINCRFFFDTRVGEECNVPKNISKDVYVDIFWRRVHKHYLEPIIKNANNDCQDYLVKEG
jgi:hypothetical protein